MTLGARLQRWIDAARRDVMIMYLAARHPGVPRAAKFLAFAAAAYALSPIDLIPDFIPVLGLLDELIVIPFCFWIITQMIPEDVMEDLRVRAAARTEQVSKSAAGLIVVVSIWLALAAAIWFAVVSSHD